MVEQASCFEDGQIQVLAELDKLAVNIQAVRKKDTVIAEVRSAQFWDSATPETLEYMRRELRGIMKYRQSEGGGTYDMPTTSTTDEGVRETERAFKIAGANEAMLYRRRLKTILDEMVDNNPTLQKIRKGDAIKGDELKTLTSTILTTHPGVNLDVLNDFYGRKAAELQRTVQELIGLDSAAIEEHFKHFLHEHPSLTAKQVQFMNLLKNYIAEHGNITIEKLYDAPFNNISHRGIDGVFETSDVDTLIAVMKPFITNDNLAERAS